MNWYYDQGGERQGPVDDAQLDALIANGSVRPETLVWCEGMANWAPLSEARPTDSQAGPGSDVPEGWIRCAATGRYFPPSQIVYIDGKPYSAEAKQSVVQGVMQGLDLPSGNAVQRNGPAWEQRAELGMPKAIWETIKGALIDPIRTFATMKRSGGLGAPLGYYVLVGSLTGIVSLFYNFFFNTALTSTFNVGQKNNPFVQEMGIGFYLVMMVLMPLILVIWSFLASGVWHLSLMICGGAKQGFETTFRAHNYVFGSAAVINLIPVCGVYIGFIWGLVSLCFAFAKTHEIHTGRAVIAVLLPVAVCCVLYLTLVAAVVAMLMSFAGSR